MKKSLVALAALAVAGVASAQSTVTLSGTLDPSIEKISGAPLQLQNSRNGTTQITVSGVEDLGGGLKARFQISSSFDSTYDNATATSRSGSGVNVADSRLGNNGMFLALDGGFGSLILGRPLSTLYSHHYSANTTKGVTGFAATNTIETGSGLGGGVYTANAIQYVTPNFAGFTAQLEYAPSEVAGVDSTQSLGLRYVSGPFGVSFVTDRQRGRTATTGKVNQLAAFWDFGVAKLSGTYQDSNAASNADQAWVVGVNVPVGPGQFWLQYGNRELAGADARIVGAGYKYSLSKRTTAYVNLGNRNAAAAGVAGKSGYGIGLQHNF